MTSKPPKKILLIFAHPDDETSSCGGTISKYSKLGSEIFVCTATNGNKGDLGTGDLVLKREELGTFRENEEKSVLKFLGAKDVIQLGYDDQGLELLDVPILENQFFDILMDIKPNIVITFGERGFSGHTDHIQAHINAKNAFGKYVKFSPESKLLYTAMPRFFAEFRNMDLSEDEKSPSIAINISSTWEKKVKALRMYKSQNDAQEIAKMFEEMYSSDNFDNFGESKEIIIGLFNSLKKFGYTNNPTEYFHQAYPKLKNYSDIVLSSNF